MYGSSLAEMDTLSRLSGLDQLSVANPSFSQFSASELQRAHHCSTETPIATSQDQVQDDAHILDFDPGPPGVASMELELPSDFSFDLNTPISPLLVADSSPLSVLQQSLRTVELVIRDIRAEPERTFGSSDVLDRMMNLYFDLKQAVGQKEGSI